MCSINLISYSNIMKLVNKSHNYRVNYLNLLFPLSCEQCHKKYFYTITSKFNYNPILKISSMKYLRYSASVQEVPAEAPTSTDESKYSDIFGSLGGLKYERVEMDENELKEENKQKFIPKVPRKFKPTMAEYAKIIKNYVSKGDINSAEQVIDFCIKNGDKPSDYMYSLLVYTFSIQGDLQKCYKYYSDMKSRHYKIKNNIYTSLFNACANCPDTEKALRYLGKVKEYMNKKNVPLAHAHYNVLIKAYGRHGEFNKSEKLLQKMIDLKLKIGISTLNSLMYAANTDKKSGLTHIFSIWQFMRQQRIPPNIFTYHLLLRGIRETKFGNCTVNDLLNVKENLFAIDKNRPDLLKNPPLISHLPLNNTEKKESCTSNTLIDPPVLLSLLNTKTESVDSNVSEPQKHSLDKDLIPSIVNMNLDAILQQNKLILFGGFEGIIQKMKKDNVSLDTKTITYLMELVPNSLQAEEAIIKFAYSHGIKPDLAFFNMLMKKRCNRKDIKNAKEVLNYIQRADLKPNIMTYGILAFTCEKNDDLYNMLTTMESTGCTINKFVAQPLFINAMKNLNFPFILHLMEKLKKERVNVDEELFEILDKFQQQMTKLIKTKHKNSTKENFKMGFSKFNMRYKNWQTDMGRKVLIERE